MSKNTAAPQRGKITLDGEPATITLPVSGEGTVRQRSGPKYLRMERDKLAALLKETKGHFSSPKFARPKQEA